MAEYDPDAVEKLMGKLILSAVLAVVIGFTVGYVASQVKAVKMAQLGYEECSRMGTSETVWRKVGSGEEEGN